MNTAETSPAPRRHWLLRLLCWFLAITFGSLLVCLIGLASLWFLPSETAFLRDEFGRTEACSTMKTRVQLNLGGVSTFALRSLACFVPASEGMPKETRLALDSLRAASVGVYELGKPVDRPGGALELSSIDAGMSRRGWTRMTSVITPRETVLIYCPSQLAPDARDIELCVAVCSRRELVLVSATSRIEPLLELVNQSKLVHLPGSHGQGSL